MIQCRCIFIYACTRVWYQKNQVIYEITALDDEIRWDFKWDSRFASYDVRDLKYINANENYIKSFSFNDFNSICGKKINPHLSNNLMKLISDADEEVKNSCSSINYVLNLENHKLLNITTFPILDNNIFAGLVSIIRDITQEEAMKEIAGQITESTTSSLAQSLYEQMKRNYEV